MQRARRAATRRRPTTSTWAAARGRTSRCRACAGVLPERPPPNAARMQPQDAGQSTGRHFRRNYALALSLGRYLACTRAPIPNQSQCVLERLKQQGERSVNRVPLKENARLTRCIVQTPDIAMQKVHLGMHIRAASSRPGSIDGLMRTTIHNIGQPVALTSRRGIAEQAVRSTRMRHRRSCSSRERPA